MSKSDESKFDTIVTTFATIATMIVAVIGGWQAGWSSWKPVVIASIWILVPTVKLIARKDESQGEG